MHRKVLVLFTVLVVSLLAVAPAAAAPAAASPAPTTANAARYHVVRFGETLFSIGRLYGVNPYAIATANHLPNANRIYAGQCLYIPPRMSYYVPPRTCYGYQCYCGYRSCNWR